MIILHQEMRAKPEKRDEVMAALAAIIPVARATQGVVKLRRRQSAQARCLQNKCVVIQKESLSQNHRWEREAGSGREKRPVQPLFSCMGHLPMHRDSVA